jgi:nucleoside-diphosphate-sugar epimerase
MNADVSTTAACRRLSSLGVHLAPHPPRNASTALIGSSGGGGVTTVLVLGGTGHIGSYLCPRLAADPRFRCVCVSRSSTSEPYEADGGSWDGVERLAMDRGGADHRSPVLDSAGRAPEGEAAFAAQVAAVDADVVIDMIGFTVGSTQALVEALKGTRCQHFLHVGSIWSHGHSMAVPTR